VRIREYVLSYVRRGWRVIPLPARKKAPTFKGWQELRLEEGTVLGYFTDPDANIGVLLGEPSGGLVDVDLDAPESLALAPRFLPPTDGVFGRPGKRQSHWLYRTPSAIETTQFRDVDGTMLMEIRSSGAQTMFPGSVHPNGETVTWESTGDPTEINPESLLTSAGRLASIAMVARHWPSQGSRHPASLALAGFLLRRGLSEQEAKALVEAAAQTAGDEEWRDRGRDVRTTAAALAAGNPTTGGPSLVEALRGDPAQLKKLPAVLCRWLGLESDQAVYEAGALPEIDTGHRDLAAVTKAAWDAVLAANHPPVLFRHSGIIVRLEKGDDGRPLLRPVEAYHLRNHLATAIRWVSSKRGIKRADHPPMTVVQNMLADANAPLPVVNRIVDAPVFASDGTLQGTPGYHVASLTYYAAHSRLELPEVPSRPTDDEIRRARDLIDDLLGEFPFTSPSERAHAVAFMFLPFARELIAGPTPFHLVEKPSTGTGGTLLVEALASPAGDLGGVLSEARNEEEWRKRITAKLLEGHAIIVLDNLSRLDSPSLAAAITAPVWSDRRLGTNDIVKTPVRSAWIGSGNNPTLSHELARRTVRIRIDAKQDRPWLRDDFRHKDLRTWMKAHRSELVWAALTLIQAWVAAGRPQGTKVLGMFENWSRVIGGILDVAGIPGFLGNLDDFYERSDGEGEAHRAFVMAWRERYQAREVGVADLWSIVNPEDGDPLDLALGDGSERSQKTRLGKLLVHLRDRQIGPFRVVASVKRKGAQLWRLEVVAEPSTHRGGTEASR
jgi:hypothetical protein